MESIAVRPPGLSSLRPCPSCSTLNEDTALSCKECDALLNGAVSCPNCTLHNAGTAATCEACQAELRPRSPWECIACRETEADLTPDEIVWLPCAHRGHRACHRTWIEQCDQRGAEPTCLACEAEAAAAAPRAAPQAEGEGAAPSSAPTPLPDEVIRDILGEEAHATRALRLIERVPGIVPCPTPDCPEKFALDAYTRRSTTCKACKRMVQLGAVELTDVASSASTPSAGPSNPRAGGSGSAADPYHLSDSDDSNEDAPLANRLPPTRLEGVRQCPGCRQGVMKEPNSCDKFECRCGCRFCWKCGQIADAHGRLSCGCTGSDHTFWDNNLNRAAPKMRRKRPRSDEGA